MIGCERMITVDSKRDIFISYKNDGEGRYFAEKVSNTLKEQGFSVYYNPDEQHAGSFPERLRKAVENCKDFLLVLSQACLDQLIRNEKVDWVREEILTARENGKNIVPLLVPGVTMPKDKDDMPEDLEFLPHEEAVNIFVPFDKSPLERLLVYIKSEPADKKRNKDDIPDGTGAFFVEGFSRISNIQCVDMAFHAGADWRRNSDKLDILTNIVDKNITLRILVNSADTVSSICSHMSQPLKKYVGFDSCVEEWIELAKTYPDVVHVRIADVPLLHRLYILRGEENGYVNIKYYTYGNCTPDKDFRATFDSFETEYKLYTEEFDYIWNKASHNAY